jgi:hypothetical protein
MIHQFLYMFFPVLYCKHSQLIFMKKKNAPAPYAGVCLTLSDLEKKTADRPSRPRTSLHYQARRIKHFVRGDARPDR